MDSPLFKGVENIAGRGIGLLAAATTIKSGGLANYMMQRQRMIADPSFRASLAGSPFTSGFFGVGGEMGPAPAAPGAVPSTAAAGGPAPPSELVGSPVQGQSVVSPDKAAWQLPTPTAQNTPGYMPGAPRQWMPDLPPYDPKQALEQQGLAMTEQGVAAPNVGVRAQYKMAAGMPLTDQEIGAAALRAQYVQKLGGPGTVVQLDIPGMKTNVGSPYNFSAVTADEYPTMAMAAAAAASRNASIPAGNPQWTVTPSGRGSFLLSPPATAAQAAPLPPPATPPNVQQTTAPPPPPPRQATAPPPPPRVAAPVRPAAPVQPVTPPPAAAAPPPPPSPPAADPFDRDAIVPHVVVPEGQVGFPSGAFDEQAAARPPGMLFRQAGAAAPPPAADVPIYDPPKGFVFHHSGGTTLEGLRATLKDRGLGSEYLMDRDGTIYGYAGPGSPHMQPNDRYGGIAPGLSNANAYGMEVVARNNADVTPAQVASAQRFMAANYPTVPVYGHGEVNPGHKQADEGMAVVSAIRAARTAPTAAPVQMAAATPEEPRVAFAPPAFLEGPPPPAGQLTVPVVAKPPVIQPPMPAAEPPPPPGGPTPVLKGPTDYPPGAQMPMSGETRRTQEGEQTFRAPDAANADTRAALKYAGITNIDEATPEKIRRYWETQRYLDRQRAMDKADIDRTQKAVLEGDGAGLASLMQAKVNVNKLLTDFPDANRRAYYVGTLRYPMDTLKSMFVNDPELAKFHREVNALGVPLEGSSMIGRMLGLPAGSSLLPGEQSALRSVLPSGATEPATFEDSLQAYRDTVDSSIAIRDFLRGRPTGATSVAEVNGFLTSYNDALAQRRLDAFRGPPAPPATAAPAPSAPPAGPPPPAAPWAPSATWTIQ